MPGTNKFAELSSIHVDPSIWPNIRNNLPMKNDACETELVISECAPAAIQLQLTRKKRLVDWANKVKHLTRA
ncbi:hypothetical protein N7468_000671 [Penicillium chermesinum]|uniref:Uncharacterized protein n=1 Tax=Penicillium chermesinum TaxID=63820 RepID=A0A9W9PMM2_9EURO|nr:uncharacterized protein N7468_000671 [Penicillium chermesinum]KAJ5249220.1 hypothetical protein N7468_000671 [Penicillium chermesinum]